MLGFKLLPCDNAYGTHRQYNINLAVYNTPNYVGSEPSWSNGLEPPKSGIPH